MPPGPADVPAGPVLGQFYNPDAPIAPGGPDGSGADLVVCPFKPIESNCYGRVDYFRWIQPRNGADQLTESGALYTIGYVRRMEGERLRGELFGGAMTFSGAVTDSGTLDPFQSSTSYIGVRGEYEHLWNLYDQWPAVFLGIGTRIWDRDMRDAVSQSGAAGKFRPGDVVDDLSLRGPGKEMAARQRQRTVLLRAAGQYGLDVSEQFVARCPGVLSAARRYGPSGMRLARPRGFSSRPTSKR